MSPFIHDLIEAGAVVFGSLLIALSVNKVFKKLAKRFDRTDGDIIDDLFREMRLPAILLVSVAGLYIGLIQVQNWQPAIEKYNAVFQAAAALVVIVAITHVVNLSFTWYARRVLDSDGLPSQLGLLKKISVLAVWILGVIQVLAIFGQPIGTVLASLGIAGLAVGLALQDTIANLFAGIYLVVDRSLRAGDYIKLESGEEGFVEVVGWRNTRVRLWANNIVLVPNNKLIQSTIVNMTLPDPVLSVYTWCGVSYDSDLERVEQVTLDVANKIIRQYEGADLTFDPVVRFKEFGDSNITFVVIFRAVEVGAQYLLQHEFIKALHKRFNQEGIEISYPVRKLVWESNNKLPVETTAPTSNN